MSAIFDAKTQRRNSDRAAAGYRAASALQSEVQTRLLESLAYLDSAQPQVIVDVGSGPGAAAAELKRRWPKARVLALDWSMPMLRQSGARWWRRAPPFERVCADAAALPMADDSVDLIVSNLCLHGIEDLPATLSGFRRVLRPDGLLLFSSLGPDTLRELRDAFASVDDAPHIHPFPAIQGIGDALMAAGFRDPVLDREHLTVTYPDVRALLRDLRASGGGNALQTRRRGLTGKTRFARAQQAYEAMRRQGVLPSTWEIIYAQAWGPKPGAARREGGIEIASVPVSQIPIRRRGRGAGPA